MAFKKGMLTESDIRVIETYSKKNLSDSIQEAEPAANAHHQTIRKILPKKPENKRCLPWMKTLNLSV